MDRPYLCSIVDVLKSVERPGFFATGEMCSMPLPALSLNNSPEDILGLPLAESQARSIIASSTQAPFGRGEETIVDTSVRRTWQLNPTQFSINNPQWRVQLQELLKKVTVELGCDANMTVTCELYKLLLYEPGGFFKRHRDTEKCDGMFGTLVIQLPSNYTGGNVAIYHKSKSLTFDFSGPAGCSNFHYVAFYADCQHEIKPVTKGYRLCLIYNLMYSGPGSCPTPADNQQQISTVVSSIQAWNEDADPPSMMVYMLEHKYCEASLSFKSLKNTDRAMADVLISAKKEVKFDLYVGNVNLAQNWSATHFGGYYARSPDYSTDDLIEEYLMGRNLRPHVGSKSIPNIDLDQEYLIPEDFFDTIDPDEEELEEATGNEGATVEKQYNWAALLFWPRKKRVVNIGIENMVNVLKNYMSDRTVNEEKRNKLAKEIVQACTLSSRPSWGKSEVYMSLLQCVQSLENVELITAMISAPTICGSLVEGNGFSASFLEIGHKFGWNILLPSLQAIINELTSYTSNINKCCQFLHAISDKPPDALKALCKGLIAAILSTLSSEQDSTPFRYCDIDVRSHEFVCHIFESFLAFGCDKELSSLVHILCSKPKRYPVLGTLVPACKKLYESLKGAENQSLHKLFLFCIQSLEKTSRPTTSCPVNWSQPVKFPCSCKDCSELMNFLKHPTQTKHSFKVGQGRRLHLHQMLNNHHCSVTHVTEHIGNPHTLHVTKTQAVYEKDAKRCQNEKSALSCLQDLIGVVPSSSRPSAKRQKVNPAGTSGCCGASPKSHELCPVIDLTNM